MSPDTCPSDPGTPDPLNTRTPAETAEARSRAIVAPAPAIDGTVTLTVDNLVGVALLDFPLLAIRFYLHARYTYL